MDIAPLLPEDGHHKLLREKKQQQKKQMQMIKLADGEIRSLRTAWQRAITTYGSTELTYPSDRLAAVVGMVSRMPKDVWRLHRWLVDHRPSR